MPSPCARASAGGRSGIEVVSRALKYGENWKPATSSRASGEASSITTATGTFLTSSERP